MKNPDVPASPPLGRPWVTMLVAAAALVVFLWPAAIPLLEYDRSQVLEGQWWRTVTGNLVHLTGRELMWNLAVLVPAGVWAERISPLRARFIYVVAPILIAVVLFFLLPRLGRFDGLSGVAAGALAFLALAQLRSGTDDRWFWRLVLALLSIKIIAEAIVASHWAAHIPDPTAQATALVHLAGVVAASLVLTARTRRARGRT